MEKQKKVNIQVSQGSHNKSEIVSRALTIKVTAVMKLAFQKPFGDLLGSFSEDPVSEKGVAKSY